MSNKGEQLSDSVQQISMTAKSEHKHYTKDFKNKKNKFKHKDYYQAFVRKFFAKIAEKVIENPDGVFIEGVGYFFCFMHPSKKVYNFRDVVSFNYSTEGHIYRITFAPAKDLAEWCMDRSYSKYIKDRVKEKLLKGELYKSHYYYLKRKNLIY